MITLHRVGPQPQQLVYHWAILELASIYYHTQGRLDGESERGRKQTDSVCEGSSTPPSPISNHPHRIAAGHAKAVLQIYLQQICWTWRHQQRHLSWCCATLHLRPHAACLGLLGGRRFLERMHCLLSCLHWGSILNMHTIFEYNLPQVQSRLICRNVVAF